MILGGSSRTRRPLGWFCYISPQKTAIISRMSVLTGHSNGFLGGTWEDRSWSFYNLLRGKGHAKPHGSQPHSCHDKHDQQHASLKEEQETELNPEAVCSEETGTPTSVWHVHYRWSKRDRQRRALKETQRQERLQAWWSHREPKSGSKQWRRQA